MKNFYTKKYFEERDALPEHLAQQIAFILKKHKAVKVLDVGSGTGKLVKFLNDESFQAIGVDSAKIAVEKYGAVFAKATNLPFSNSTFDAVLSISLIEHLERLEAEKFLSEAARVLKKEGLIFLVTPNFATPLRLIFGKKWFGYQDSTHKTFFTPGSLARILENYGFFAITLTFPLAPNLEFDWPAPIFFKKIPNLAKTLVNFLLISTPAAFIRNSFWIAGVKR